MRVITYPTAEPITLEQARKQCKVDASGSPPTHEDDDLIAIFNTASREWCEAELGMAVAPTGVEIALDAFPTAEITLEAGPILQIDSITYFDADNVEQILGPSVYTLDTTAQVAVIRLQTDQVWPASYVVNDAVKVRYTIGYSVSGDSPQVYQLPASIKVAILLVLGHLYANRSNTIEANLETIPMGARAFLSPLKLRRGFA